MEALICVAGKAALASERATGAPPHAVLPCVTKGGKTRIPA